MSADCIIFDAAGATKVAITDKNNNKCGCYSTNSQIKLKTAMLKSTLSDYNDAFILSKEIIKVEKTETEATPDKMKK